MSAGGAKEAAGRIPLWIDLRAVPVNKRLPYWKAVARVQADAVVLGTDDPHLDRKETRVLRIDGNNALKAGKKTLGRYILLRGGKDQDRAAALPGIVIVEGADWSIIPLENLIAARRDRPGTLYGLAHGAKEALRFRDTLEIGVHGVVLEPANAQDIEDAHEGLVARGPRPDDSPDEIPEGAAAAAADPPPSKAPSTKSGPVNAGAAKPSEGPAPPPAAKDFLVAGTVTKIQDAGPGDRVCVDATSMFRDGEGLLVGSTARGFILVHAETLESEYVAPRPFRVNAGAVHSYLYMPGGKTRYLSELRAGMNVMAVHPDGVHRVLTIGRAKIENRPHTLVAWKTADGSEGSAILQTAETIRLVTPDSEAVAVTALKVGDKVLVHTETAARHFGMPVKERLTEI